VVTATCNARNEGYVSSVAMADWSFDDIPSRGGFIVAWGIAMWKGGKLQTAGIHGLKGGAIKVRYGQRTAAITLKPGQSVHLNADPAAAN